MALAPHASPTLLWRTCTKRKWVHASAAPKHSNGSCPHTDGFLQSKLSLAAPTARERRLEESTASQKDPHCRSCYCTAIANLPRSAREASLHATCCIVLRPHRSASPIRRRTSPSPQAVEASAPVPPSQGCRCNRRTQPGAKQPQPIACRLYKYTAPLHCGQQPYAECSAHSPSEHPISLTRRLDVRALIRVSLPAIVQVRD